MISPEQGHDREAGKAEQALGGGCAAVGESARAALTRNFRLEGPYAGDVRHVARLVKGLEAAELVNLEPDPA
eukprot:scaffold5143_cov119-Isochrysis_galbana.AAC.7